VWPEDAASLGPHLAGTAAAGQVSRLARRLHASVVVGVTETVSAHAFRNEAVVFGPGGSVVATYQKVHRVPFGEYVPDRGFFADFATLSAVPLTAVPGRGSGMVRTPAGRLGLMISYEVFFADRGRSAVRAGAELLVVPTNTTSYNSSQVPTTEVAADRVQAVAEGRQLVQSAPTGYTDVVDADGDVVARAAFGRPRALAATVGLRTGRTVYERAGDLPVLVVCALAVAAGLVAARRRSLTRSSRSGYRRRGRLLRRTWRG
jgi:apolipoprotein N-acyltransferase